MEPQIEESPTRSGTRHSAETTELPLTVIRPARGWQLVNVRELWHFRDLIYFLIWRDVKVRYKQTLLGAAWSVLQPGMMMVVFTIFFSNIAKLPSGHLPYPVFVLAGLMFLVTPGLLKSDEAVAADEKSAEREQVAIAVKREMERVQQFADANPALEDLSEDLKKLEPPDGLKLQRPDLIRHEALKKIDKLEDAVKQKRDDEKFKAVPEMKKMLRGLKIPESEEAPTEKLSKALAKGLMSKYLVPTAAYRVFTDPGEARRYARNAPGPLVVKADGVCAGKGVLVCDTPAEAVDAVDACMVERRFGEAGARVVLEERLTGREASVMALTDGRTVAILESAQDRTYTGDPVVSASNFVDALTEPAPPWTLFTVLLLLAVAGAAGATYLAKAVRRRRDTVDPYLQDRRFRRRQRFPAMAPAHSRRERR